MPSLSCSSGTPDQQTRGQPNIHFPCPPFRLQEKITEPCGLSQREIVVSLGNGDLTGDQQSFPGHLYSTSMPKHHSHLIPHRQTQHFEQITSPPTWLSNVTLPGQSSFNILPLLPPWMYQFQLSVAPPLSTQGQSWCLCFEFPPPPGFLKSCFCQQPPFPPVFTSSPFQWTPSLCV